jgi:hypothetical protein
MFGVTFTGEPELDEENFGATTGGREGDAE